MYMIVKVLFFNNGKHKYKWKNQSNIINTYVYGYAYTYIYIQSKFAVTFCPTQEHCYLLLTLNTFSRPLS